MCPETRGLPSPTTLLADFRPHAVAADQRAPFDGLAVVERDADAVAVILVGVDAPARLQRDQVAALTGLEKGAVDVGPMGDRVRLAEPFEEGVAQRNIGDELAGEGVAHFLRGRTVRVGQDRILQADLFQHAKDVRPELDAGADLAEFGRLLENAYRKALVGKRVGRDQAADAAAGNEKGGGATVRTRHGVTSITNTKRGRP